MRVRDAVAPAVSTTVPVQGLPATELPAQPHAEGKAEGEQPSGS